MQQSIEQLLKIKNGFKPFEEEAEKLVHSHTIIEAKSIAIDLLKNEAYQIRCCAVFIRFNSRQRQIRAYSSEEFCSP